MGFLRNMRRGVVQKVGQKQLLCGALLMGVTLFGSSASALEQSTNQSTNSDGVEMSVASLDEESGGSSQTGGGSRGVVG